jgi:nicotinate-nucleotide adenylyltransferase
MQKIGYFGGSFNPPHNGHLAAMQYALIKWNLDSVIMVPTWEHAFAEKKNNMSFAHRFEMCRLCIGSDTRFHVLDLRSFPKLRTIYTINFFRQLFESASPVTIQEEEWFWIVGQDCYDQRDRWKEWDLISGYAKILVLPQRGSVPDLLNISSTEIKAYLHSGARKFPEGIVPEDVWKYITDNNLYKE